jgi:hypothetical protein
LKNKAHDVRKPDVGANFGYGVLYGDPKIEFSVRRGEGKREKREGERGKERKEKGRGEKREKNSSDLCQAIGG